jgi:hypothetical protein
MLPARSAEEVHPSAARYQATRTFLDGVSASSTWKHIGHVRLACWMHASQILRGTQDDSRGWCHPEYREESPLVADEIIYLFARGWCHPERSEGSPADLRVITRYDTRPA